MNTQRLIGLVVVAVTIALLAGCGGPATPDPVEVQRLVGDAVRATVAAMPTPEPVVTVKVETVVVKETVVVRETVVVEATATPIPTPAADVTGASREAPAGLGVPVMLANGLEWTALSVDADAWPEVLAENEFNDPPAADRRMLMVRFRVRNIKGGAEPASVSNMGVSLVGSSNKVLTPFTDETYCGVVPDELSARLFEGGETEGNVCWSVPAAEEDLVVLLESMGAGGAVFMGLDSGQGESASQAASPAPTVAPQPTATTAASTESAAPAIESAGGLAAVLAEFKAAGLEAESVTTMGPDDYGLAPVVAAEAQRFLIPSLCPDCGGRIFLVTNDADRARLRAYYDELSQASAAFFSWVFECEDFLVQINGELPEDKARQYEAALSRVCED